MQFSPKHNINAREVRTSPQLGSNAWPSFGNLWPIRALRLLALWKPKSCHQGWSSDQSDYAYHDQHSWYSEHCWRVLIYSLLTMWIKPFSPARSIDDYASVFWGVGWDLKSIERLERRMTLVTLLKISCVSKAYVPWFHTKPMKLYNLLAKSEAKIVATSPSISLLMILAAVGAVYFLDEIVARYVPFSRHFFSCLWIYRKNRCAKDVTTWTKNPVLTRSFRYTGSPPSWRNHPPLLTRAVSTLAVDRIFSLSYY